MNSKSRSSLLPIAGSLIVPLCVGILYLWSVFKTPLAETYNWSLSQANMVSSYMILAFVCGCFIGGYISDKIGPKITSVIGIVIFALGILCTGLLTAETISFINLTYAIMGGFGSGVAYNTCISCTQKWLPHKRGLATGLACGAFGLSTVVFTPLSNFLMKLFTNDGVINFKMVFITLGLVFAIVGIAASLLIRLPDQAYLRSLKMPANSKAAQSPKDYAITETLRHPMFWCLFFSLFFINGTWNLCVPLIKDLGMARGLTESAAIACVSFTGITNFLGRIIMSSASDKIGRTGTIDILCAITFAGAALTTFITGYGYFAVIALIAFAYGGPSAVFAALSTDLFGAKNAGVNYGAAMLALGLSSVFFNWVSNNVLKASVENVTSTFVMGAAAALVPIILMAIIKRYLKKRNEASAQV